MSTTKTPQNTIRILLADDHLVVREGIMAILKIESDFEIVGEVADGICAVQQYEKLQPDVLILDLRMPGMDGFAVVRQLVESNPKARILIMTTYDTDEDIWKCLSAGAKGYLLKDATHAEIVTAVRTVAAGESFTTPALAAKIARRANAPELTQRESDVLRELAAGKTNKEIAMILNLEEGTIKSHLKKVFEKLDATTRTEAVFHARERGILE